MSGLFISFEGIDGAGKSTHIARLQAHLEAAGRSVCLTREPGGTALGEAVRDWVLHQRMQVTTELLLMFAARAEHVAAVIRPALAAGQVVLCDRFTDASRAYQGGGRGVPKERLEMLASWAEDGVRPGLTVLFDVPPQVSRQRLAGLKTPDRFEQEQQAFFERVRAAYLDLAAAEPDRFVVLDASQPLDEVSAALIVAVDARLS